MKQKTNKKMLVLSVIGIIIVVLGHTRGILDFAYSIFPYASFEMPLFVFISGYFYKVENQDNLFGKKGYLLKKIKKILIPYFIWNLVYGVLVTGLRHFDIVDFGTDISLQSLFITPWQDGHQYILNLASWFLLALFLVNIVYVFLRKFMMKLKMWDDDAMLAIFLLIASIGILIRNVNLSATLIPLTRTMFFLFFYHFGYYYKTKLECKCKNNFLFFIIIILLQLFICMIDGRIEYGAYNMSFQSKNPIISIAASLTGILFWTKIAELIEPVLSNNKIVNYIGNNTFEIMMHHQLWIFILNTIIWKTLDILNIDGFNLEAYKSSIYYFYLPFGRKFLIIYSFIAIAGPLIIKFAYEKCCENWKRKKYYRNRITIVNG